MLSPTLQLNRRTALFVKDGKLFIKLSKIHPTSDKKPDVYILKKLPVDDIEKIHAWCAEQLNQLKIEDSKKILSLEKR